jgi:Na+-transporting methylmalonyl-CoA/oxaloacetate decarboxylase gamma subunit
VLVVSGDKIRRRVACMAGTVLSVVLLVAGVVVMLVLHILIVVWALRRGAVLLRSAAPRDEERANKAAAEGLSAEELGVLPFHVLGKAGGGDCAVCLEAFQAGDRCRVLPGCEHGFHAPCVDSWLRRSRACPICRAEVVVIRLRKAAGAVAGEAAASEVVAERQCGADR